MHKPCTEKEFVREYNKSICLGVHGVFTGFDYLCNRLDDIKIRHNTSDYWDPHKCTNSCQDPSYGCPACTNPDYFQCIRNNQSVCIHPDLHCNHHPDCDNAEDERNEVCNEKYVDKFLVKEFATLREGFKNIVKL